MTMTYIVFINKPGHVVHVHVFIITNSYYVLIKMRKTIDLSPNMYTRRGPDKLSYIYTTLDLKQFKYINLIIVYAYK